MSRRQPPKMKNRNRAGSFQILTDRIESDPAHHLAGPFMPQTPLGSNTPERSNSPVARPVRPPPASLWQDIKTLRWAVEPASAFKLLLIPLVLYVNWEFLTPYIAPNIPNPFAPFILISHYIPESKPDDPRYAKGPLDILFIAYNIVFFSFVRQVVTLKTFNPLARYFGIKKEAKLMRFGEQGYAMVYFAVFGAWGFRIMTKLPTWWYRTEYFWIDYPHWDMIPELKRYYLMQMAYWCQQLIVLLLGLEKPRKDYAELVAHHFVTLWLVGWSYLTNLTIIGNAIYMSMDIPDVFLAFSKLLNYMQLERAKVVSFGVFILIWTYFRHYLNIVVLWSVWFEFSYVPDSARELNPWNGNWMVWWIKYLIFLSIAALQVLNLFWYFLIMRILYRSIMTSKTEDERSDDEDEGDETKEE